MDDCNTHFLYCISIQNTNCVYIGQTVNPEYRRKSHFSSLKMGKHHNSGLQALYLKHGESVFVFQVIASGISGAEIHRYEAQMIEQYRKNHTCLNAKRNGGDGNRINDDIGKWSDDVPGVVRAGRLRAQELDNHTLENDLSGWSANSFRNKRKRMTKKYNELFGTKF